MPRHGIYWLLFSRYREIGLVFQKSCHSIILIFVGSSELSITCIWMAHDVFVTYSYIGLHDNNTCMQSMMNCYTTIRTSIDIWNWFVKILVNWVRQCSNVWSCIVLMTPIWSCFEDLCFYLTFRPYVHVECRSSTTFEHRPDFNITRLCCMKSVWSGSSLRSLSLSLNLAYATNKHSVWSQMCSEGTCAALTFLQSLCPGRSLDWIAPFGA